MAAARALPLGPVKLFNPFDRGAAMLLTADGAVVVLWDHSSKPRGQVKQLFPG